MNYQTFVVFVFGLVVGVVLTLTVNTSYSMSERKKAHDKDMVISCERASARGGANTYSFQLLCKEYGIDLPVRGVKQ